MMGDNIREYTEFGIDLKKVTAFSMRGVLDSYSTPYLHYHPFHQILMINSGISLLEEEMRKQPLYGNMAAFIPSGLPHRSIVVGSEIGYQSVYFKKRIFHTEKYGIMIFKISELGIALFNRLNRENLIDISNGFSGQCLDLFLKVLSEDISIPARILRLPKPAKEQNRAIVDFIHDRYSGAINLDDFIAVVPYSTRHLSRIFRDDLKISIFEYIRMYRMLMASILLNKGEKNITEVAFGVGYESISSFYRDFRKYYGIAPKEFRRKIRNGSA